jgi:hypothetical protein
MAKNSACPPSSVNLTATEELPIFRRFSRELGTARESGGRKVEIMSPALVLATVNAPYSVQLKAHELAHCLIDQAAAEAMPGHMSSFFGEVTPALQLDFADQHGITPPELKAAAKAFGEYSGESYPLAA